MDYDQLKQQLIKINALYSSGKMNPNAVRLVKKHPQLLTQIIDATSFLPGSVKINERLYCIINNITQQVKCQQCGNPVTMRKTGKMQYPTYCSRECLRASSKAIQKRKATMVERYGVEYTAQSEQLKNKMKQTCKDKFGVDNPFKNNDIQRKAKQAIREKFSVDNVMHDSDVKKKHKQSCQNKDFEQINQKIRQSTYDNNGYYNIRQQHLNQQQVELLNDIDLLNHMHNTQSLSLTEIANDIGVDPSTISLKFNQHNIPVQRFSVSVGEKQIFDFIKTTGVKVMSGDRTIICPQELDIYLPDHKLAIEYCGLYWHSEQQGKDRHYHKTKQMLCAQQGIQLLTIFEDEWINRQQQIKDKILSLIGQDNRQKIFARKCQVIQVSSKVKQQFFEQNHIQGDGPSSINIALQHGTDIVAVMGFIKHKDQHYLNRYATSARVVGGFSKLLKYFENNFEWNQLVSFADLRWSDGNLYRTTGWQLQKEIPPDYGYSPDGKQRIHKFNYRRKNLPRLLKHFDPSLSECKNCDANGILRVWDCGKQRWVKTHK